MPPFRLLMRGEFLISSFINRRLRQHLPHMTSGQVSWLLNRSRVHGLAKKVVGRYKYYLTESGRQVVSMALKLRERVITPELAFAQTCA